MPRHRVDREIAAGKIVLHALRKANRFGMTPVGVKAVETIRGYLDTLFAPHCRDATEFDARPNNLEAFRLEGGFTLLPGSRAANVHVVARSASQRVAYPAAHDPRLEPRSLKSTKHLERRCGRRRSVQGRLLDGNARHRAGIDMQALVHYTPFTLTGTVYGAVANWALIVLRFKCPARGLMRHGLHLLVLDQFPSVPTQTPKESPHAEARGHRTSSTRR